MSQKNYFQCHDPFDGISQGSLNSQNVWRYLEMIKKKQLLIFLLTRNMMPAECQGKQLCSSGDLCLPEIVWLMNGTHKHKKLADSLFTNNELETFWKMTPLWTDTIVTWHHCEMTPLSCQMNNTSHYSKKLATKSNIVFSFQYLQIKFSDW